MWLSLYYVFAILTVIFVNGMIRVLSRSKFRNGDDGDTTIEVGFEEDSVGNLRKREYQFPSQEEREDPHMGIERFMQ